MEKQPLDGETEITAQDRTEERTGEGAGESEKEEMGKRLVMGEGRAERLPRGGALWTVVQE